ncbi:CheR-type MCP methyltransferase [Nitrosomonas sp. Nm84]|uniref:CheR family methyltransferase n=1 Tax=Nitrosomonas sp. Nm84 TaxID=200124 RepID=UPI000D7540BB|nr:CheR family methyltransferase [Nitrosomonas sp. Nm84]PXW86438.1 CheR-type MCP methyltransferase [Nitrosomonas sp. Nm84]
MFHKEMEFTPHHPVIFLSTCEESLYHLIIHRTGIVLRDHQMPVLRSALAEACSYFGYEDIGVLLQQLRQNNNPAPELEFLLTRITIGESYFFRHTEQMSLLRDELLPELIVRKRLLEDYSLRVWSAGCANGQEIYSIVIMLHEMLPDIQRWKLQFLATDINREVLADAVQGCYKAWSLRATPEFIMQRYFAKSSGDYQLRSDICQQVKFAYLNLAEDIFPAAQSDTHVTDIILCRNVFIYLEPNMIRRIMNRFAQCLVSDGLLFLGPADFTNAPDDLEYIQRDATSYFTRKSDAQPELPALAASNADTIVPPEIIEELSNVEKIPPKSVRKTKKSFGDITLIRDLLRTERWYDALLVIDEMIKLQGKSAELLQAKSKALANLGHVSEALQTCEGSLTLDPTEKLTYLLQGTILIESGQFADAESAFRKAIFLDHAFSEAHYQLGLLLIHQGDRAAGLKCLTHALTHAKRASSQHEVHNAPGMTYARFVEIIQDEMSIYANTISNRR